MKKIYIAAPLHFSDFNKMIKNRLQNVPDIEIFLPASLHDTHGDTLEDYFIAQKCYDEIDTSDIIVVVIPFGLSVAAEIGYVASKKRENIKIPIIAIISDYGVNKREAMIDPFIDYHVNSFEDLEDAVRSLL